MAFKICSTVVIIVVFSSAMSFLIENSSVICVLDVIVDGVVAGVKRPVLSFD